MREVRETELPGVGVLHEYDLQNGDRVGVITRHSGRRELVVYDRDDPDAVSASIPFTVEEAATLAELLGGTKITSRVAEVQHIEGLSIDWIALGSSSPALGRTISDLEVRRTTGASIVAVMRHDQSIPAPGPDHVFTSDDTVVVVGSPDGIAAAAALLGVD